MTVLIFAGSETTASALAGIMRMLLQNPDKLRKLVHEVRSSFAAGERNVYRLGWPFGVLGSSHQ
ncbi:hypothetical protein GJ744_010742 [Endocarpon pusillum]|uniref:Cytochrome P450 n=1 Tax=Endocarpon pusillum TaxID=364733 RepID=A0A8H7AE84_9EURO|nr:hypothetical protein GJ744_010742 [Endocarpon pusillum]